MIIHDSVLFVVLAGLIAIVGVLIKYIFFTEHSVDIFRRTRQKLERAKYLISVKLQSGYKKWKAMTKKQ